MRKAATEPYYKDGIWFASGHSLVSILVNPRAQGLRASLPCELRPHAADDQGEFVRAETKRRAWSRKPSCHIRPG